MAAARVSLNAKVESERTALDMTQRELGGQAGCSQAAISLFERGHNEVLSAEKIRRICEILKIDMSEHAPARPPTEVFKYCPNFDCANQDARAFAVHGRRLGRVPTLIEASGDRTTYCAACGQELVAEGCPNCHKPLVPGAVCCMECGEPYVWTPAEERTLAAEAPAGAALTATAAVTAGTAATGTLPPPRPGFIGPTRFQHHRG